MPSKYGIARGIEHACQEREWGLQIFDARTDAAIEANNLTRLPISDTRGGIVMPIGNMPTSNFSSS